MGFLAMVLFLNIYHIGGLPDEVLAAVQRNHLPGEGWL